MHTHKFNNGGEYGNLKESGTFSCMAGGAGQCAAGHDNCIGTGPVLTDFPKWITDPVLQTTDSGDENAVGHTHQYTRIKILTAAPMLGASKTGGWQSCDGAGHYCSIYIFGYVALTYTTEVCESSPSLSAGSHGHFLELPSAQYLQEGDFWNTVTGFTTCAAKGHANCVAVVTPIATGWGWIENIYTPYGVYYDAPPPPETPTIATLPASDLDWFKKSATLNGESAAMKQVYFKWGGEGLEHDSVIIPAASSFSIYLHKATRDRWYYFQAVGIDSSGSKYYGDVLSFMLTQTEAQPAYVTKLIIRGQPLVPLETMTLFAKDAASIANYGRRTYSLSTQYSLSQDDTQVILNTILAANKDPRVNNLIVTFQSLKPGAFKDSVIAADISTRITLINTLLGIDGDFFINNVKHTITEAGLSYAVQWRLERVYETTPAP